MILASVYLDPEATDYNRIYRYNYGATKLALRRAMDGFPDTKTLLYEKDRSTHAVMGFKVQRLWDPPYLQVALDLVDMNKVASVLSELPENDHLIIEAGTPLIKKFGLSVISEIRKLRPNAFIIADMKILDTGNLEARMAADCVRRRGRHLRPCTHLHPREGHRRGEEDRDLLDHRHAERR